MSTLKGREKAKFRKSQGRSFRFNSSSPSQLPPDIPYSDDDELFEKDHPELYHEMKRRDLTIYEIRYIITRKIFGFGRGEIRAEDLVSNREAIITMYEYLAGLEQEAK